MAIYPKQLQFYDESTGFRTGQGEKVIYSNGFTPAQDITVNQLILAIDSTINGIDLTGATGNVRSRPRIRQFDTSFGDTVVFPGATPLVGDQTANELIAVMRVLYGIERTRGANRTGLATSVLT